MASRATQNKLDEMIHGAAKLERFPGAIKGAVKVETEAESRRAYIDGLMKELTGKPFDMKVCGYKIALYLPTGAEKSAGGIIIPEKTRDDEVLKANCGLVLGLGPDAYNGKDAYGADRFPSGPWCAVGDWVGFQRYETTAALVGFRGVTIAVIPDDKIDSVVPDRKDLTDIKKNDLL